MKPAETLLVVPGVIGAAQVEPVQAPVKPPKLPPSLTAGVRTTAPIEAKTALQLPLALPALSVQLIPDGTLVTVPLPVPVPMTTSVPGGGGTRQVTSTIR